MKTVTILFLGMFLATLTFAKSTETKSQNSTESGIAFHKGTWAEALQIAEKAGKPIFLDISASWCGPCKMLKSRTFPNDEVGKFYNAKFINVAVDGEKGEGAGLARKYNIKGYPTLIFLDSKGEIIAQTAGYRNPKQFIELGKKVINK